MLPANCRLCTMLIYVCIYDFIYIYACVIGVVIVFVLNQQFQSSSSSMILSYKLELNP